MKTYENLNQVVQGVRKTLVNEMVGKSELDERDYSYLLGYLVGAISASGYVVTSYDIKYQDREWVFPQVVPKMEGLSGALQLMNMLLFLINNEKLDDLFNLVV